MAKIYHVNRPPTCALEDLEATLNRIVAAGGTIVTIMTHSTIADNGGHDHRYCVTDIIYTTNS